METYLDDASFTGEEYEDPRCQGCTLPIDDGSVVQFGDGIWHFECFRCSKCQELVECYSNLLLLRDGSPICERCSYNCHICHKTIKDEAIMTGEEAYHAECFRCIQCDTKIEDLVFTQTSKGIFCTKCHEARKQLRQKRKEEKLRQQQKQQEQLDDHRKNHHNSMNPSLDIDTSIYSRRVLPLDKWQNEAMSRQLSTNSILNDYVDPIHIQQLSTSDLSVKPSSISVLSAQELAELETMLNAAIDGGLNDDNIPSPPPELRGVPSSTYNKSTDLQQELEYTKQKLHQVETDFNKVKTMSRKALEEFNKMKEEYNAEITARREAEEKLAKLQDEISFYHHLNIFGPTEFAQYSRDELGQLHKVKVQVEQSVNDIRKQRDIILADIERQKHAHWDRFSQAHQQHLISLQHDTDHAKLGYARLVKARDDIISEMIMLNTKNAELSSLNNDLSRRMTEREREAIAVMAGTSFLTNEPSSSTITSPPTESGSGRQSPDHLKQLVSPKLTAHRDSFNDAAAVAPPRRFKFRRNRSRSNSAQDNSDKKDTNGNDTLISVPYDTNIPVVEKSHGADHQLRVGNHLFNQTKFLRPTKCDVCNEKMWRGSELKCQECSIVCHTKCVYRTTTCQRKVSSDSSNSDCSQKVSISIQSEDNNIPLVVRKCIEAVEQRGMDYEGIYRKSGGIGQVRSIQQAFEQNEDIDLCDSDEWNDICAITSVLKQYFRDLPNPLFTFERHQQWVDAIVSGDKNTEDTFQKLLYSLPIEHYNTLKYLMQHLAK
ncbi:uncharacterized protein BX664DRAFT_337729 [Halteromyces radiatus]|uniref:uncharacterized protein n=1 Tax=Halteromyces radiatus TaxID=101107 RepID=UPI00221E61BC|nr:uncharacterized protein BX664DRAFT_337729 [Halteromyces radiatus]KAI8084764.1 hypothetical protein BX664DRAFT_337729 [Halteromyces radiatus]